MKVIHYSRDSEFKLRKIKIKNSNLILEIGIKPNGGLWTSPAGSKYGWDTWCNENDFGDINNSVKVEIDLDIEEGRNLIVIRNEKDLYNKLIWIPAPGLEGVLENIKTKEFRIPFGMEIIDFETIKKRGIDCIHLTEHGQWKTRLCFPRNLYGWDCECILILNEKCIKHWEVIKEI